MARFLLITWPGGGNVHPLVALATRLLARGHEVRALAAAELRPRFEVEGVAFRAHRTTVVWAGDGDIDLLTATPAQRMACHLGLARDIAGEVARERTDAIVVDFMQPDALCAAQGTGLPVAAFVHTLYTRFAKRFSPMDLMANREQINALCAELGLPPVEHTIELLDRSALVLVTTIPEFDQPSEPLPANARYIGPIVEDAGPDAGWTLPCADADVPLVVVGLGTTPMDELAVYQRVFDALADLPLHVLATVGDHINDADLRVPANGIVARYVRHAAVLPHASLFVTHAGLSGISTALSLGVPMLCIPLGRDQPSNAAQVATIGAGTVLQPAASVEEIRARVAAMLAEPSYRLAAKRVAAKISAYGNGARAVEELERLVAP